VNSFLGVFEARTKMTDKRPKIAMFNPQASPKMPYDGPPMSILAAVCMLDPEAYDVKVIDWHYPDFEKRIASECADALIFGVTCMTGYQIGRMLKSVAIARAANPGIKVVCGGWHPTLLPEQILRNELIDYVVRGQGPWSFRDLVECIRNNRDPEKVPGVGYKKDGRLIVNERPPIENINNFPRMPYRLLDRYEDYLVETSFARRAAYILTTQGCPFDCFFCSEAAFHHRKWTARPVEWVIETVKEFKDKYGIDGVVVADSNFFVNEKRVAEFCRAMIPLGLKWGGTSSRSDQLARYSDETWDLMEKSGLHDIFLGVESASNETLKVMNKGNTIEDTLAVLPKAKQRGIRIQCSFVIGVPGIDIQKDFETDMKFINDIRHKGLAAQFHMFSFTPYPGVPFLQEAFKLGYKQPDTLDGWAKYDLHADVAPWIPPKYPMITDQLSVYFMFLAGHARKVAEAVLPPRMKSIGLLAERMLYHVFSFRVEHSFFAIPVEYKLIKFVLLHKDRFFGGKKLLF
jgi:radical SAM superfamily enzyme YgiQ (UPF0313 family)